MVDFSVLGMSEEEANAITQTILNGPPMNELLYEGDSLGAQLNLAVDVLKRHEYGDEPEARQAKAAVYAIGNCFIETLCLALPETIPDNAATTAAIDGMWQAVLEATGADAKEADKAAPGTILHGSSAAGAMETIIPDERYL